MTTRAIVYPPVPIWIVTNHRRLECYARMVEHLGLLAGELFPEGDTVDPLYRGMLLRRIALAASIMRSGSVPDMPGGLMPADTSPPGPFRDRDQFGYYSQRAAADYRRLYPSRREG